MIKNRNLKKLKEKKDKKGLFWKLKPKQLEKRFFKIKLKQLDYVLFYIASNN